MFRKSGVSWGSWVGGSAWLPIVLLVVLVLLGWWLALRYQWDRGLVRFCLMALTVGVALLLLVALLSGPIQTP